MGYVRAIITLCGRTRQDHVPLVQHRYNLDAPFGGAYYCELYRKWPGVWPSAAASWVQPYVSDEALAK